MTTTAEDLHKAKKLTVEEYFAIEKELDQKFEYQVHWAPKRGQEHLLSQC